jgi:hypothetical protein
MWKADDLHADDAQIFEPLTGVVQLTPSARQTNTPVCRMTGSGGQICGTEKKAFFLTKVSTMRIIALIANFMILDPGVEFLAYR